MLSKIISQIKTRQSEIVLAVAVVLIAIIAFESGKISALRHLQEPLKIVDDSADISGQVKPKSPSPKSQIGTESQKTGATSALGRVVASKNSTLYHFLWCTGSKKIKEENKITFSSEQEAQSKGYTLASNCQR